MRSNRIIISSPDTAASSTMTLPHLKARPTIHAGLLRPVRLNRTKIAGHPGAPPPAPTRKKRRKHSYTHRYVGGEEPPELRLPVPHALDNNRTQGAERSYSGGGGGGGEPGGGGGGGGGGGRGGGGVASRSSKDRNERGESSNNSGEGCRRGVIRSISPREDEPLLLSCCSVPASVVNASSLSPEFSRQGQQRQKKKVVHAEDIRSLREEPGPNATAAATATAAAAAAAVCTTRKPEPRRTSRTCTSSSNGVRGVYGRAIATQPQADRGGRQDFVLVAAGGNKRTSLIRFRPATREEVDRSTRKATTTVAGGGGGGAGGGGRGGKISPPSPRVLPERGRQPATFRRQREQPEQSDNGGLGRAILKLSPSPNPNIGDECDGRDPQRHFQSEARSVGGRPIAAVTDTHWVQKHGRVEAGGHEGRLHVAEAALGRSEIMGRPAVQEGASRHTTTSGGDDRPCDHRQHHSFPNNRKQYGRVSSGLRDDPPSSSSPVNTLAYHVAGCMCELCRRERSRRVLEPPGQPTFKVVGAEPKLVLATLEAHRFKRHTRGLSDRGEQRTAWRVLWSSQHLRSHVFRNLKHGQRMNSFPRTYECTRKDSLARNMNRMSEVHGARHFSFAPRGFVLPAEREVVREAIQEAAEEQAWIVKPASSACGRGIFITKNFANMPVGGGTEGNWIAQRYVEDPLLLDGLKFDLRLYVAVTSFRPLRVYLHEEGLCRLATEPYSSSATSFGNRFMHLTNYSINRRSSRYEPGTTGNGEDEKNQQSDSNDADPRAALSPARTPQHVDAAGDNNGDGDGGYSTPPPRSPTSKMCNTASPEGKPINHSTEPVAITSTSATGGGDNDSGVAVGGVGSDEEKEGSGGKVVGASSVQTTERADDFVVLDPRTRGRQRQRHHRQRAPGVPRERGGVEEEEEEEEEEKEEEKEEEEEKGEEEEEQAHGCTLRVGGIGSVLRKLLEKREEEEEAHG